MASEIQVSSLARGIPGILLPERGGCSIPRRAASRTLVSIKTSPPTPGGRAGFRVRGWAPKYVVPVLPFTLVLQ